MGVYGAECVFGCLVVCCAVKSSRNLQTFRRFLRPPSSGRRGAPVISVLAEQRSVSFNAVLKICQIHNNTLHTSKYRLLFCIQQAAVASET